MSDHPGVKAVIGLLLVALAIGIVGLVLRGIAYLLVFAALAIAAYAAFSWWRGDRRTSA